MATRRWSDLSDSQRKLIVTVAVVDSILKAVALWDLRRRPAQWVRGPKKAWGFMITFSNTAGLVPLTYFVLGRRKSGSD